jgi:hypothetical protein
MNHFLFMLWCPGVHVVQCCLITCVHVFNSCCDVLGFMLFKQHEPQDITTWTKNVNTCNKTTLNNMNPRTSQHEPKTWTHVIRQHWGSCCSMLSYYMCSRFLFMVWCPGVHVVQCCLITCVHVFSTLNNMNPRTSQHEQKTWTHVIRQHWTTWIPGHYNMNKNRVVQCCLITCVHVFCSCCDILGFMLFNVVLLHVFTVFVHVVMSWGSCCSMLSYYMCL